MCARSRHWWLLASAPDNVFVLLDLPLLSPIYYSNAVRGGKVPKNIYIRPKTCLTLSSDVRAVYCTAAQQGH